MKKTTEQFIKEIFEFVCQNGLENTSIRDICMDTGMSTGSLYYRFKSKEGVVISVGTYGLNKVADDLFSYALSTIGELKVFFDSFLGIVKTRQPELRAVYQIATSPVYGQNMRKMAETLNIRYEKYIERLSNVLRISIEELTPIVFMIISVMLDYVVWDDYKVAQMQMNTLYNILSGMQKRF